MGEIAECIACEEADYPAGPRTEGPVTVERVHEYFAAHAELGYAALTDPAKMIGRKELVKDLRRLGVTRAWI